jgi:hypothetical protein
MRRAAVDPQPPTTSFVICSIDPAKFESVSRAIRERMAGEPHEIVGVHDARGICEGYNRGAARAIGERLVFCHDDIDLLSPDFSQRLAAGLDACDLVGVAGTDRLIGASWTFAAPPHIFGQVAHFVPDSGGYVVDQYGIPRRVIDRNIQALDGVFLAMRRQVWETIRFDEETFRGWHLYDMDFTFRAHLAGFRLAVCCDILLAHASPGLFSKAWELDASAFLKKHGRQLSPGQKRQMHQSSVYANDKADALSLMTPSWWDAPARDTTGGATSAAGDDDDADDRTRFDPMQHPIIFDMPRLLSAESAWVQHIPLAYLMIDLVMPRVLVELGTHHGDSYCAFCQAVASLQTETRCFAVDTWQGDPHAGFYGPQVLATLKTHHDPLYGSFSTLLQMDFDAAVSRFEDGSIDLLHIDGHHTYEAVRHDFELWLPKMSPRGVVLFHDTNVRNDPSFGVWRLWEEVAARYMSFEFPHAHGLGVAAVGAMPTTATLAFLRYAQADPDLTRVVFFELGRRIGSMQLRHKMANRLLRHWHVIARWRQQTGQPDLGPIDLARVYENPEPLGRVLADELQRLAQDDLNLRQQLPTPPAPPPQHR